MQYKTCTKCGKELPATTEYFSSRKDSKDGMRDQCKECIKEREKQYREENKEKVKEYWKQYREENKEKIKKYKKQYREENKEKVKEYSKQYYEENKEYYKRYKKQYNKEHPEVRTKAKQKRRALKFNLPSTLTVDQWNETKEYFNNRCAYCGKEKSLAQEHFVPLSKGGEYTHNNIIPACRSCNSSKNNKDFFEWYPQQPYYSKEREQKILDFLGYQQGTQQLTIAP